MLTVLGEPYTNDKTSFFKLINQVPSLKQHVKDYSGQVKSLPRDKTIIHMQAQAAFVNMRSPINNFNYIGTKKVHDCIQVFIFHRDSKQCLSIHVDFRRSYQLESMLKRFYLPENAKLEMWLVGGIEDAATSRIILNFFLRDLSKAASNLNLTINIAYQMLFKNDYASQIGLQSHIFDNILEQANLFSLFYLKQPLDFSRFSERSVAAFDNRDSPAEDNEICLMNALLDFVEILRKESQLTQHNILTHEQILNLLGLPKPTDKKVTDDAIINRFYFLVDALLSRQGYEQSINRNGGVPNKIEQYAKFRDLVIDLDSYSIYKISQHQPHVLDDNEIESDLTSCELSYDSCEYPLIFDGAYNCFYRPQLSDQFKSELYKIKQNFQKGDNITVSDDCLNDFIDNTGLSTADLNIVGQFMLETMLQDNNPEKRRNKLLHINYQSFFAHKPLSDIYKKPITSSAVNLLQKRYPSLEFQGWQRHEPAFFIDALVLCESHQHATVVKNELAKDGLVTEKLIRDQGTYICVPAINIGQYAENIRCLPETPNNHVECVHAIAKAMKPILG